MSMAFLNTQSESYAPSGFATNQPAQKPFAQVLVEFAKDTKISDGAFRMYVVMQSYARQFESCWPSQTTLAKDMGVSERTVGSRGRELAECGKIEIEDRRHVGLTNLYKLKAQVTTHRTNLSDGSETDNTPPPPEKNCATHRKNFSYAHRKNFSYKVHEQEIYKTEIHNTQGEKQPSLQASNQTQGVCVNNSLGLEKGLGAENQKGASKGHIPNDTNYKPNKESDRKRATDKVAEDVARDKSPNQVLPHNQNQNDEALIARLTQIGMTLPAATKSARIAHQKGYTSLEIDNLLWQSQTRNNPAGWLKWAFDNEYKGSLARHLPKVANDTHRDSAYRDNGERQTDTVTSGEFDESDNSTNDTPLAPAIARPTPTPKTQQTWLIAQGDLKRYIDVQNYDSWIRNLVLTDLNLETQTATIYTPSTYATKKANEFYQEIQQALSNATNTKTDFELVFGLY